VGFLVRSLAAFLVEVTAFVHMQHRNAREPILQ
jgi:hypothetical protein